MNEADIKNIVDSNKLVLFAKGSAMQPMCGFSANAIHMINKLGKPFSVVNIFDDPECRPALIAFSGWPTTPQLFVGGELIGGSDIIEEMMNSGDLQKKVEAAFTE